MKPHELCLWRTIMGLAKFGHVIQVPQDKTPTTTTRSSRRTTCGMAHAIWFGWDML